VASIQLSPRPVWGPAPSEFSEDIGLLYLNTLSSYNNNKKVGIKREERKRNGIVRAISKAVNSGWLVGRLACLARCYVPTSSPRRWRAHPLAHIVCEIPSIILRHSQRRLLLSSRAGTSPPRAHTRGSTTTLADGVVVRHGGKPQRRETRDALHPVPRDALAHTACFSPPS
jgi:hypothetical protein